MAEHIGVGMTEQSKAMLDIDAAENQPSAFYKLMDIVTVSDLDIHALPPVFLFIRISRAIARSLVFVILIFSFMHSTSLT